MWGGVYYKQTRTSLSNAEDITGWNGWNSSDEEWYSTGTQVVEWQGTIDTTTEVHFVCERKRTIHAPVPLRRHGWPYQLPPPWIAGSPEVVALRPQARPSIILRRQHRDSFIGRSGTLKRWKAKRGR